MNHKLACRGLLVVLVLSLARIGWSQPVIPAVDFVVSETEPLSRVTVKLPIRLYGGYLAVVEGSVGNIRKLNFLVDTGAYPSVIDGKLARRLNLIEQAGRVNLWKQSIPTRLAVLPSLVVVPLRAESLPVVIEDLSFLENAIGRKVDGIVGLDILRQSSFTMDYLKKEIIFGPVGTLTFSTVFDTDTPVVTIRTRFENFNLRLVVDTGGPDLMLFQSRMPAFARFDALAAEKVADVSGAFRRRKVQIPNFYLGPESIGTQVAFIVEDRKDEGDNFDGVLGVKAMRFSKVAFDFEHRRFSWEITGDKSP
jgi:hypothetical protein